MSSQSPVTTQPHSPSAVHPHPIRWDIDRQLWVCSPGLCDFTRPKREGEVVPTREEAREEAQRAGTGADFSDLRDRPAPASAPSTSGDTAPAARA